MTTKPRILKGFMELSPSDQILFDNLMNIIETTYKKYGFYHLNTPVIECEEVLLAKTGGDTNKEVYRFSRGDTKMALRFDLTVPLARYVAMNHKSLPFPFKRYQIDKVFRGENTQRGRFREFYQCDIDIIGSETLDVAYDAEFPNIICEIFELMNLNFQIQINNRKLLVGFVEQFRKDESVNPIDVINLIDKRNKIKANEFQTRMTEYIPAFEVLNEFISISDMRGLFEFTSRFEITNPNYMIGLHELEIVFSEITNQERSDCVLKHSVRSKLNLSISRGLDYYTGTIYETILLDSPECGSICSGGRYDNLASAYTNSKFPGVGISIGLTRLFDILKSKLKVESTDNCHIDFLVIPFDDSKINEAGRVAKELRSQNFKVDVVKEHINLKSKFKYANKLKVNRVIIVNSDLQLKDMKTGEQLEFRL